MDGCRYNKSLCAISKAPLRNTVCCLQRGASHDSLEEGFAAPPTRGKRKEGREVTKNCCRTGIPRAPSFLGPGTWHELKDRELMERQAQMPGGHASTCVLLSPRLQWDQEHLSTIKTHQAVHLQSVTFVNMCFYFKQHFLKCGTHIASSTLESWTESKNSKLCIRDMY